MRPKVQNYWKNIWFLDYTVEENRKEMTCRSSLMHQIKGGGGGVGVGGREKGRGKIV
jgi:hypothetical protein